MSIIDKENEVWTTFIQFRSIFETEAKGLGIDVFGTDKIEEVANALTMSYFLDKMTKELSSMNQREDRVARRAFHIENKSTFRDK
mgnify:CR=1 FL=1